jgi:hypothetical protein
MSESAVREAEGVEPPAEPGEPEGVEPPGEAGEAGEPVQAGAEGPAEPQPLGVALEPTGDAEVDALLERLADADALPTEDHLQVYEDVHRGLRDTLTALDSRQGPPPPARPGA